MSLHSYHISKKLVKNDPPFYSLIMAAMRKADTHNLERLCNSFPDVWSELQNRYNAPLGVLPEDNIKDMKALHKRIVELEKE